MLKLVEIMEAKKLYALWWTGTLEQRCSLLLKRSVVEALRVYILQNTKIPQVVPKGNSCSFIGLHLAITKNLSAKRIMLLRQKDPFSLVHEVLCFGCKINAAMSVSPMEDQAMV